MSQKYVATNQTCASIDRVTVNIWICHRYFFWYKVNIRHWGIRIVRSKCVAKSQPTISNICSGIPSSLNRVQTRTRHVFSNLLLSCTQGSVQWQAGCVRACVARLRRSRLRLCSKHRQPHRHHERCSAHGTVHYALGMLRIAKRTSPDCFPVAETLLTRDLPPVRR